MDDISRFLANIPPSWIIYFMVGSLFAFLFFVWIIGKIRNIKDKKFDSCPECKQPNTYKKIGTVNMGTTSGHKQKWNFSNSKWKDVYATTTSYETTYQCSNCGHIFKFPWDKTKEQR